MKQKINKKNTNYSLAPVLYQKLGNDWYAFTEVDGDCFMSKVNPEDVEPSDVRPTDSQERKRNKAA